MPPPSPCVNVDVTLHRCQTTLAEKQYLMSWNKNWLFGGCDWLMPSRQTSDPWPAVVNKKQKKLLWSGFFFTLPCFMSLPIEHWLHSETGDESRGQWSFCHSSFGLREIRWAGALCLFVPSGKLLWRFSVLRMLLLWQSQVWLICQTHPGLLCVHFSCSE